MVFTLQTQLLEAIVLTVGSCIKEALPENNLQNTTTELHQLSLELKVAHDTKIKLVIHTISIYL